MATPLADPPAGSPEKSHNVERRGFLTRTGVFVFGAIAGLVPTVGGLAVFLDPLRRRSQSGKFVRVTTLEAVPDDGIPREFPVVAERIDAWNRSLEPIGAVYLRRTKDQAAPECWTATCPHAGCFVAYDVQSNTFKCPCHNSEFQVDGQIISPSPSPRPMDTLECRVDSEAILVKFENFYTGKAEKVVKQ
jgi:menaquinol-cytochrome c reductase iron-sulfur subunit